MWIIEGLWTKQWPDLTKIWLHINDKHLVHSTYKLIQAHWSFYKYNFFFVDIYGRAVAWFTEPAPIAPHCPTNHCYPPKLRWPSYLVSGLMMFLSHNLASGCSILTTIVDIYLKIMSIEFGLLYILLMLIMLIIIYVCITLVIFP